MYPTLATLRGCHNKHSICLRLLTTRDATIVIILTASRIRACATSVNQPRAQTFTLGLGRAFAMPARTHSLDALHAQLTSAFNKNTNEVPSLLSQLKIALANEGLLFTSSPKDVAKEKATLIRTCPIIAVALCAAP